MLPSCKAMMHIVITLSLPDDQQLQHFLAVLNQTCQELATECVPQRNPREMLGFDLLHAATRGGAIQPSQHCR